MSISAVSGSDSSYGLAELLASRRSNAADADEIAASIMENDDQDGDGFLSLVETPLDEDRFNEIDTDGDGLLSTDELSADAEEHMSEGMPDMQGLESMNAVEALSSSSSSESSGSSDSESSDDEEEYDTYDLNEDGVVTMDELLQAFRQGDTSLQSLFESTGGSSSLLQRLATEAYEAQSAAV